jgi:putative ABC transport system permease protein
MLSASRTMRTGFAVDGVAMIETDARYAGLPAPQARQVLEEIARRVAATPGVQAVALTRGLPMERTGVALVVEGSNATTDADDAARRASSIEAGPAFFDTMAIPILFGRAVDERDSRQTPRVAVISESMARQYFGGGDVAGVIGRRFRPEADASADAWIEVVGVARDTRTSLVDPMPEAFYQSFAQSDHPPTTVVARTSLDAAALVGVMQRELRAVNAMLPVVSAKTMTRHFEESLVLPKTLATFLGGLGALGLALAGIGLYAVVAFAVSRRSREIGIRMALGARRQQAVWTVARDVGTLVGVGTAAGLALTLLAILALRAVVVPTPGISVYRPTVAPLAMLTVAAFVAMVGLAAAYVPARRAALVDPLVALRRD